MSVEQELLNRSGAVCELCGANENLSTFAVSDAPTSVVDGHILICSTCKTQIESPENTEPNHWRCLNDSMWSTIPAVQVMAWRMLDRLRGEGWPADLLDMLYLDEETLAWAEAGSNNSSIGTDVIIHKDSNGAILQAGDTVILIKDLNVKGANFTAKRGTAVRNINLPYDDATHIEGKVNGQTIYILTQFVKKN